METFLRYISKFIPSEIQNMIIMFAHPKLDNMTQYLIHKFEFCSCVFCKERIFYKFPFNVSVYPSNFSVYYPLPLNIDDFLDIPKPEQKEIKKKEIKKNDLQKHKRKYKDNFQNFKRKVRKNLTIF